MNIEATIAIIIFLLGCPFVIIFSNFFERYEKKMHKIRTAILGFLIKARNELVQQEIDRHARAETSQTGQESNYDEFIDFMQRSKFLKYANEYEEMLRFEENGEGKFYYLSFEIVGLVFPLILIQLPDVFLFGYIWLLINLAFFISTSLDILNMVTRINRLYRKYEIQRHSFGGYD